LLIISIVTTFILPSSAQFSFTAAPVASTCPQNGEINFTSNCTDPAATFVYLVTNTTTGATFTTTTTNLAGLPAGTYDITGQKLLGGSLQTFVVNGVIVPDDYEPIRFTIEKEDEICGGDGKITVVVDPLDLARVASIEIIAGPMTPLVVNGNQFCDLVSGTYRVRVNHVGCPDAEPIDVTITMLPSSYQARASVLGIESCDSTAIGVRVFANSGSQVAFPISYTITACPPGLPPVTYNGTITSGFSSVYTNILNYNLISFPVKVVTTDRCGVTYSTRTSVINNTSVRRLRGVCQEYGFLLTLRNGVPPANITFCQSPAGFNPANNNFGIVGPFTSTSITFGSLANPLPLGTYELKIEDECREYTTTFTLENNSFGLQISESTGCDLGLAGVRFNSFNDLDSIYS